MTTKQTILITGASGLVGTTLRSRLARSGRTLRLVDIAEPKGLTEGEEFVKASFVDMGQMEAACRGADAVIDLARFEIGEKHTEETWNLVTEVNMRGIYTTIEAARRQGATRYVYASSNHVLGYYETTKAPMDEYVTPMPDTYYGVGKAMGEALASYYHNRFGMDVLCVRIGSQFDTPRDVRMLSTWLSPDDAGRLFEACLSAPAPGFRIVWGISANTRSIFSQKEGRQLGYDPQDDAEVYAAELIEKAGDLPPDSPLLRYLGGASALTPG